VQVEGFMQPHGNKRYRLSLQILDITPTGNIGSGPKGEISTYVISNTGESMFEMLRDMLGQSDQPLWFEHMQTIIISEAAAKQGGLQPMIDFFRRDPEMRWGTKILITSGQARPLLEYQPPTGEPSGMFIANSLQLYRKNPHVLGRYTDIGDFTKSADNKSRFLMARIELIDNIVKLGGMALFKKGKFIGYVDEYATQGGDFLSGIEKSAIITIECPEHPGKIIVFELFRHSTTLTPQVDGENIYYTLDIDMKGNLGEVQCGIKHDMMDAGEIHKIETWVAEEVKRNALYSFHVYQDLKVDGSVFGAKLKAHEPLVWEKVKDHWNDEVFPNVSLIVSVNVVIENIGEHK
jgi:Ger(x)C family germination protein